MTNKQTKQSSSGAPGLQRLIAQNLGISVVTMTVVHVNAFRARRDALMSIMVDDVYSVSGLKIKTLAERMCVDPFGANADFLKVHDSIREPEIRRIMRRFENACFDVMEIEREQAKGGVA